MRKSCARAGTDGGSRGCARKDSLEIPTGSDVTVQKRDGVSVTGKLVEVKAGPDRGRDARRHEDTGAAVADRDAALADHRAREAARRPADAVATTGTPAAPEAAKAIRRRARWRRCLDRKPEYREVTVPAGTVLSLELTSAVASDTSNVEDPVRATLRSGVSVDGVQALPAGTAVLGHVTSAERSAKVKGRASIGVPLQPDRSAGRRRPRADQHRDGLAPRARDQEEGRDEDRRAAPARGAVIGGILGGGDGAAKGAAIGGGAGTAAVLATRGEEVRLGAGTPRLGEADRAAHGESRGEVETTGGRRQESGRRRPSRRHLIALPP